MNDQIARKVVNVFIASPGDLAKERAEFRKAIEHLNSGFGDGANVHFNALGWEDSYSNVGARNQSVFNEHIDECDVFFLIMHRRWGQEAIDAAPYTSYTEEEFHRALNNWNKYKKPRIFVFFKPVDIEQELDPGPQLQKVLAFKKELEASRKVIYKQLEKNDVSFSTAVDFHLRGFVKGTLPDLDEVREAIILPIAYREEVEKARFEAQASADAARVANLKEEEALARLELVYLESATEAFDLAGQGLKEHARQKFIKLLSGSTNKQALSLAFHFFQRTSDLSSAASVLDKLSDLIEDTGATKNAGVLHYFRGCQFSLSDDLKNAETEQKSALKILEALEEYSHVAFVHEALGDIYNRTGTFDKAEHHLTEAIEILHKMAAIPKMPSVYLTLGRLYRSMGNYAKSEIMITNALTISSHYADKWNMVGAYNDLGLLHKDQGQLDAAKEMFKASLKMSEALGIKLGSVANRLNLGFLFMETNELSEADRQFRTALDISLELGSKRYTASSYSHIGLLHRKNGDMENALKNLELSLELHKSLEAPLDTGNDLVNIGGVYALNGDNAKATEMLSQALTIFDNYHSSKAEKVRKILSNIELGLRAVQS